MAEGTGASVRLLATLGCAAALAAAGCASGPPKTTEADRSPLLQPTIALA